MGSRAVLCGAVGGRGTRLGAAIHISQRAHSCGATAGQQAVLPGRLWPFILLLASSCCLRAAVSDRRHLWAGRGCQARPRSCCDTSAATSTRRPGRSNCSSSAPATRCGALSLPCLGRLLLLSFNPCLTALSLRLLRRCSAYSPAWWLPPAGAAGQPLAADKARLCAVDRAAGGRDRPDLHAAHASQAAGGGAATEQGTPAPPCLLGVTAAGPLAVIAASLADSSSFSRAHTS